MRDVRLPTALFLQSFALVLYELVLTRLFAVTLFADFAHLALALALLGVGIGAMAQHLRPSLVPEQGLERRVALLGLLQGVLTIVAVLAAITFPVLTPPDGPPLVYQERSQMKDTLLDPLWFAALLPVLMLPFACAGLAFSGAFFRRKSDIGVLYGADLLGAAAGALVFVPVLEILAGPDAAFVALLACAAAVVVVAVREGDRSSLGLGGTTAAIALLAVAFAVRGDVLKIREAAGYSDDRVVYTRWTPLTRLAIHRDQRGDYMLLDNTSASEIVTTEAQVTRLEGEGNRAIVYKLHDPPARVAILAASAGPEVSVAQGFGYEHIDAIDIAAEIFDIVGERYADAAFNPYLQHDTHRIYSDGRAAILRATEPYDIIQMVHANLWSSAGLMSNAWSPALLETTEAFETYLDHLSPDGTISFGKGSQTDELFRAAIAALRARGVADPRRCVAYIGGNSTVMLVKKRPWTEAEHARLVQVLHDDFPKNQITLDPTAEQTSKEYKNLLSIPPMTDDHPYNDTPAVIGKVLGQALEKASGEANTPVAVLYRSIVVQFAFAFAAGALFLGVPLALRGRTELAGLSGVGIPIAYVACLGYGYLSIETVLIHELVLFVGHPVYAVTIVVLAMLLASGVGSVWASRPADPALPRLVPMLVGAIVALGAVLAFAVVPLLYAGALYLPLAVRVGIAGVVIAPLAFVMGTAFPLGVRLIPDKAARVLPWAWAINGWMSVVGSLSTVLVARLWGYTAAFALALLAYAVAAGLATRLSRVGR